MTASKPRQSKQAGGGRPPPGDRNFPIAKVLVRRGRRVLVTHLDLAVFLFLKRVYCADAVPRGRGQYEIVFYDPNDRAEGLALDYVNHAQVSARAFAAATRDLKCLLHRFNNK